MRSLHPADAVHKGFGTIPTSILQRKNGVCIYERPACRNVQSPDKARKNGGLCSLHFLRFLGGSHRLDGGLHNFQFLFVQRV